MASDYVTQWQDRRVRAGVRPYVIYRRHHKCWVQFGQRIHPLCKDGPTQKWLASVERARRGQMKQGVHPLSPKYSRPIPDRLTNLEIGTDN